MRGESFILLLAIGASGGCAASMHRATVEHIGGAERPRTFASGTAYEAYLRAELAVARGDATAAARQLELAIIADPADPFLAARRAEVLLLAHQPGDALEAARDASRRFPQSAAAWLALGEALAESGDASGAGIALTRALAAAPDDPEIRGAVARLQGASHEQVAHAIENAPAARAGDRTVAQRLALDPVHDDRATLRTVRRARASRAWEQHAYRQVDLLLSPLVAADPSDVNDRVRVIEARARDGRPRDAAALMASLPSATAGGPALSEHARLWLLADRPALAMEEAQRALAADANDLRARVVLGEALLAQGDVAAGARLLAEVPPASPSFIDARIAAARALARSGHGDDAEVSLARSIDRIAPTDTVARDRLRLARAQLQSDRGAEAEAREALASIESPWGRQRRGAQLIRSVEPTRVLADLRARDDGGWNDGIADAWIALLCTQHTDACTPGERDRALGSARDRAPEAPETLRALALSSTDRRTAMELLREAALRDPLSPWNDVLSRQLGMRSSSGPVAQ